MLTSSFMVKFCVTICQVLNLTGGLSSMTSKSSFVRVLSLFNLRGQLEKPVPGQLLRSIHLRFISEYFHETIFFKLLMQAQGLSLIDHISVGGRARSSTRAQCCSSTLVACV